MSYDVAYLYGLEHIDARIAEVAFLSFVAGTSLHTGHRTQTGIERERDTHKAYIHYI